MAALTDTAFGYFSDTPPADAEIIEFVVIKLVQLTNGFVNIAPAAQAHENVLKRQDYVS